MTFVIIVPATMPWTDITLVHLKRNLDKLEHCIIKYCAFLIRNKISMKHFNA